MIWTLASAADGGTQVGLEALRSEMRLDDQRWREQQRVRARFAASAGAMTTTG